MNRKPSTLILTFLMGLAPMGALIFTPGLPSIANYFSIPLAKTQWVMTIYLLGYALGMLFYGPIANAYGRKPALYLGLLIGLVGALFSGLSKSMNSFTTLFIARFLMAFGTSSGYTITLTIIGDYYKVHARKMLAIISFGALVLPYLGVVLSGTIVQHFGWEMTFYLMALIIVILFIASISLPETTPGLDKGALNLVQILSRYSSVIRVSGFLLFTLIAGSVVGLFYLFGSLSSILGIGVIEMTPKHLGTMNLFTCLGFIVGNPLTAFLAHKRLSAFKVIALGLVTILICSFLYFLFFLGGHLNPWTLFLPAPLLALGLVMIWSTGASQALHREKDKANASSLISFLTSFIAFLTVFISGFFNLKHPLLMPIFFLAALVVILINMLIINFFQKKA